MTTRDDNPSGESERAKERPRTGDPRKKKQKLRIDRLPTSVHTAIRFLYEDVGLTWKEIGQRSALPINKEKPELGGFVPWDDLPLSVLELFPGMRIPKSNLQRWYDIRVEQQHADVLRRSTQARELAQAFAQASMPGSELAVTNAARDVFMGILGQNSSEDGRMKIAKELLKLALVQQRVRTNDIRERMVEVEDRRVTQLELEAEARRKKMDAEADKLRKKAVKGVVTPADIDRLRETVFGLPPTAKAAG